MLRPSLLLLIACVSLLCLLLQCADAFAQPTCFRRRSRGAVLGAVPSAAAARDESCSHAEAFSSVPAVSNPYDRRQIIQTLLQSSLLVATVTSSSPSVAIAIPFIGGGAEDKRQLELCLVAVLRVKYWAMAVSKSIDDLLLRTGAAIPSDQEKAPYLEARLGSKALLTGRVGGGANSKVYALAGLQLKGCVKDAEYWATVQAKSGDKKDRNAAIQRFATASEGIIESLAACVEFDGLETTLDPSPRSSLMLGQYTNQKAMFVTRMLKERVIPSCDSLVRCFDGEARERSMRYLRENYYNELPPPPPPPPPPPSPAAETESTAKSASY